MTRLTTQLKQLEFQRDEIQQTLDDIDQSVIQGHIHELTWKTLTTKYEAKLTDIEHELGNIKQRIARRKRSK